MTSVFVTGSRDWPSQYVLDAALKQFCEDHRNPMDWTLINGGVGNADACAVDFWLFNNVGRYTEIPPDEYNYQEEAKLMNNINILNQDPDYVLLFIYNHSPTTTHTWQKAKQRGLNVVKYEITESMGFNDHR